jgi:hypothetical protein
VEKPGELSEIRNGEIGDAAAALHSVRVPKRVAGAWQDSVRRGLLGRREKEEIQVVVPVGAVGNVGIEENTFEWL